MLLFFAFIRHVVLQDRPQRVPMQVILSFAGYKELPYPLEFRDNKWVAYVHESRFVDREVPSGENPSAARAVDAAERWGLTLVVCSDHTCIPYDAAEGDGMKG